MTNVTWAGRAVPPALLLFLAGCATVAHGTHQRIPVQSDPSGARVQVDCGDAPHHAGFTPVTVELPRKAEFCGLTLMKAGFSSTRTSYSSASLPAQRLATTSLVSPPASRWAFSVR